MAQLSSFYERARPRAGHFDTLDFPAIPQGTLVWLFLQGLPGSVRSYARLAKRLVPPDDPAYFKQLAGKVADMEECEPEAGGEAPVVAAAIPQQGGEDSRKPPQQLRPPGRPEKQAQNTPNSDRKGCCIASDSREHPIRKCKVWADHLVKHPEDKRKYALCFEQRHPAHLCKLKVGKLWTAAGKAEPDTPRAMAGLIINLRGEGKVANMRVRREGQDGAQRELTAPSTPALKKPPIENSDPVGMACGSACPNRSVHERSRLCRTGCGVCSKSSERMFDGRRGANLKDSSKKTS